MKYPRKENILQKLKENLEQELAQCEAAAKSTRELATQADLKQEGKYDTRAIEASYLAGAQQKRVEEIKMEIQLLDELDLKKSPTVQMGSLVELEYNLKDRFYFLTSIEGGALLEVDGFTVMSISVFSPIGSEALGLEAGESFEVETPKETRHYTVKVIY